MKHVSKATIKKAPGATNTGGLLNTTITNDLDCATGALRGKEVAALASGLAAMGRLVYELKGGGSFAVCDRVQAPTVMDFEALRAFAADVGVAP